MADYRQMIRDAASARAAEGTAMSDDDLSELFGKDEVVDTETLADFAGVTANWAREWARDNCVARIGNAFAWTPARAREFIDEVDDQLGADDDEVGDAIDAADDDEDDA
jgi:hypothetical protein